MLHHWSDYQRSAVELVAIFQLYFPNVSSFGNYFWGEKGEFCRYRVGYQYRDIWYTIADRKEQIGRGKNYKKKMLRAGQIR